MILTFGSANCSCSYNPSLTINLFLNMVTFQKLGVQATFGQFLFLFLRGFPPKSPRKQKQKTKKNKVTPWFPMVPIFIKKSFCVIKNRMFAKKQSSIWSFLAELAQVLVWKDWIIFFLKIFFSVRICPLFRQFSRYDQFFLFRWVLIDQLRYVCPKTAIYLEDLSSPTPNPPIP